MLKLSHNEVIQSIDVNVTTTSSASAVLLLLRSFVNLFKFYKLTFTKLATPTGKFAGLFFFYFVLCY